MAEKLLALEQVVGKLERQVALLLVEIQAVEAGVNADNIKENSTRLLQLETQLRVTEQALNNKRKELTELEQLQNSKIYQAKKKEVERQKLEAIDRTKAFYKNLLKLQAEAESILESTKKIDRLNVEVGNFNGWNLRMLQPFSWLNLVRKDISKRVNDTKWLTQKLD